MLLNCTQHLPIALKELLKATFVNFGGHEIVRHCNKTPKVLFWHGVDDHTDPILGPENICKENFVKQLKYLKEKFDIISLYTFSNRYAEKALKGNEIVLTFDDGYRNNLTVLAPIMNDFSLPFTTFISTENISKNEFFFTSLLRILIVGSSLKNIDIPSLKMKKEIVSKEQKVVCEKELSYIIKTFPIHKVKMIYQDLINNISNDEFEAIKFRHSAMLPMNWEEVRELQQAGCEIGSHCLDHICCHDNQSEKEVERQIVESKNIIEEKLGKECRYFAYPNGDFTGFSNECVKRAGYKMGFATQNGDRSMESYSRLGVQHNINTFKIMLNLYGLM